MSIWEIIGKIAVEIGATDGVSSIDGKKQVSLAPLKKSQINIFSLKRKKNKLIRNKCLNPKDHLKTGFIKFYKNLDNKDSFENYILAMYALAFCVSTCDGEFQKEDIVDLNEFIKGETYEQLSDYMKSRIHFFKNFPPSFNGAVCYIKRVKQPCWDIYDDVIEISMRSENYIRLHEESFRNAWAKFKLAA